MEERLENIGESWRRKSYERMEKPMNSGEDVGDIPEKEDDTIVVVIDKEKGGKSFVPKEDKGGPKRKIYRTLSGRFVVPSEEDFEQIQKEEEKKKKKGGAGGVMTAWERGRMAMMKKKRDERFDTRDLQNVIQQNRISAKEALPRGENGGHNSQWLQQVFVPGRDPGAPGPMASRHWIGSLDAGDRYSASTNGKSTASHFQDQNLYRMSKRSNDFDLRSHTSGVTWATRSKNGKRYWQKSYNLINYCRESAPSHTLPSHDEGKIGSESPSRFGRLNPAYVRDMFNAIVMRTENGTALPREYVLVCLSQMHCSSSFQTLNRFGYIGLAFQYFCFFFGSHLWWWR